MRGLARVFGGLIGACAVASLASAQERVALVIGNEDYPASLGRLENTHEDAQRIAAALQSVGFDVDLRRDVDEDGMEAAVGDLLARLEANPGAIAFFYYSGHGASTEILGRRENLLVPAKETYSSFAQIPQRALRLGRLVDALGASGARAVFVVSDACRNEFSMSGTKSIADKGFAAISSRPGMLIAYATAEGATTPDDGLFASALAEQITRPGQDASVSFLRAMQTVAAQRPGGAMPFFTPGYIPEDVCFAACGGAPAASSVAPASPSPPSDEELTREVQTLLAAMGYDPGPADGTAGQQTGDAVEAFRSTVGFGAGRTVDVSLVATLRAFEAQGHRAPSRPAASAVPRSPGETFRDCEVCPDMVVLPGGAFTMGAPESEQFREDDEGPQRVVRIEAFAAAALEATFHQWDACVADGGCGSYRSEDQGWGRGVQPVINVSWDDAQAYVRWLSQKAGASYRLLTEAEWEYAARAGATTAFSWGDEPSTCEAGAANGANTGCARSRTLPAGSFRANDFGLHDMHGNVWEWVQDCYRDSYAGAPSDGSAVEIDGCEARVARNGSYAFSSRYIRSAAREGLDPTVRNRFGGFRVARDLD